MNHFREYNKFAKIISLFFFFFLLFFSEKDFTQEAGWPRETFHST